MCDGLSVVSSVSIAAMSSVGICVMTAPVCIGTNYYYTTVSWLPLCSIIASSESAVAIQR